MLTFLSSISATSSSMSHPAWQQSLTLFSESQAEKLTQSQTFTNNKIEEPCITF